MKKTFIYILVFLLGAGIMYLVLKPKATEVNPKDSKLLSYEIKKLNKMIVLEEYYTQYQSFEGNVLPDNVLSEFSFLKNFDHKEISVLAKGTLQSSYDMKKMKVEVDEKNKKLIIQSIPEPKFQLFTEVEFLNLDTGMINSISAEELNEYKSYVRKKIEKQVDKKDLEKKSHQQLIENLSDLYVLADALNWEIVDETQTSSEVKEYLKSLQ